MVQGAADGLASCVAADVSRRRLDIGYAGHALQQLALWSTPLQRRARCGRSGARPRCRACSVHVVAIASAAVARSTARGVVEPADVRPACTLGGYGTRHGIGRNDVAGHRRARSPRADLRRRSSLCPWCRGRPTNAAAASGLADERARGPIGRAQRLQTRSAACRDTGRHWDDATIGRGRAAAEHTVGHGAVGRARGWSAAVP